MLDDYPSTLPSQSIRHLGLLKKGECAIVVGLAKTANTEQQAISTRLLELGFFVGEQIRVLAESFPSRDPMVVRIGNTTLALRRREAAMIHVMHEHAYKQTESQAA